MKLVLVCSDFPFGKSFENAFIGNEFPFLTKSFDQISVITTNPEEQSVDIPDFVRVHRCVLSKKYPFKILVALLKTITGITRTYKETKKYSKQESSLSIIKSIFKYEYAYQIMKRTIKEECKDADLVYSFWMSARLYATVKACKKNHYDIKIVTRAHGYDLYCDRGPLPYRTFIGNNIYEIFFISENGKQYYLDTIYNDLSHKCLLSVYYLGLNKESEYSHKKHDIFHIATCSSTIPLKRLDIIVDALAAINDIKIKWSHLGDGTHFEQIKKYAQSKLGNKNNIEYEFLGNVTNKQVLEFYRKSSIDLFINCSDVEGVPVSIMEAFSFSIPVICRDVGGCREVNRLGKSFLLKKDATYSDYALAISRFYDFSEDEKERARCDARSIFNNYFSAKNIENFINHLVELAK